MLPPDLPPISEAAALIAARRLSPVELTEACLARIAAHDPGLHAFVEVTADRARAAARRAEAEILASGPRTPLHGIPYALKDIVDVAGLRTTAGSRLLADNFAAGDAAVVTRLEAAGAILLGKAATWEFAHGGPSWDTLHPPARNPWGEDRSPSGSSSGSAAAVAAGLAPVALGSDTGGSIRGPAAACGVVGLKPTYGRVSRRGVVPNCFTHDHVGPIARTCRDAALVLAAIAGHDPADPACAARPVPDYAAALTGDLRGLTIGVPRSWLGGDEPAVRDAFEAALSVLRGLGAAVRDVALPPLSDYHAVLRVIAVCELFSIHAPDLRARPELFGANLRYRTIVGGLVRAEEYLLAQRARTDLARATQAVLAQVDAVAVPTAGPTGKLEAVHPAALFEQVGRTAPFSVSGNPALSLPCGFDGEGMPLSLQVAGRLFDEVTVLRVGDAYERATPWHARRPDLAGVARVAPEEGQSPSSKVTSATPATSERSCAPRR